MADTTDTPTASMEIQSFHLVFALQRRLHRIDRWRLPFPGGIPISAIGYSTAALAAVIALRQTPGIGQLIAAMPAPLAYVLIPAAAAMAMTRIKVDGRPAHRHLTAQALTPITSRPNAAGRPVTKDHTSAHSTLLTISPSDPGYRPAVIKGPATLTLTRPAHARPAGRTLHLTPSAGPPLKRPRTLTLQHGQQLKIRDPR